MKSRTKTAIALAAVAILGGCASGGGGGGGEWHETRRPLTPEEIARQNDPCNSLGALLGLMAGGSCGGSSKSAYEPSSDSSSAYNGSASPTGSNSSASSKCDHQPQHNGRSLLRPSQPKNRIPMHEHSASRAPFSHARFERSHSFEQQFDRPQLRASILFLPGAGQEQARCDQKRAAQQRDHPD